MSLQTFTSGSVPTATKLQNVSNQTVIICTVATRPSAPIEGMHIYETDTFLQRRWDGSRWIAYPIGVIDLHTLTATGPSVSTSQVPVNNSGCTFDAFAGQRYSYEFGCNITNSTSPANFAFQCERDDGAGYVNADPEFVIPVPIALINNRVQYRVLVGYGSDVAGAKVRMQVTSSGGTWEIFSGTDVSISHIGDFV